MNVIGMSGLQNSAPFKNRELPNLSPRDYRIAQGSDSAAALVTSQRVVAAAAEERFSREKGTGAPFVCDLILPARGWLPSGEIDPVGFSYELFPSPFSVDLTYVVASAEGLKHLTDSLAVH